MYYWAHVRERKVILRPREGGAANKDFTNDERFPSTPDDSTVIERKQFLRSAEVPGRVSELVGSWRLLLGPCGQLEAAVPCTGASPVGGAPADGDAPPAPPSAAALRGVVCPQLLRSARGRRRPLGYCQ